MVRSCSRCCSMYRDLERQFPLRLWRTELESVSGNYRSHYILLIGSFSWSTRIQQACCWCRRSAFSGVVKQTPGVSDNSSSILPALRPRFFITQWRMHLYIKIQGTVTCILKCKQTCHEIGAWGDSSMHKEPGSQIWGPELRLSAPQRRCRVSVEAETGGFLELIGQVWAPCSVWTMSQKIR